MVLLRGYTGKLLDPETGLQYNINRWYDASVGRWMSVDPIGFAAADANLYRYVGNGVTWLVDSLGLCPCESSEESTDNSDAPRDWEFERDCEGQDDDASCTCWDTGWGKGLDRQVIEDKAESLLDTLKKSYSRHFDFESQFQLTISDCGDQPFSLTCSGVAYMPPRSDSNEEKRSDHEPTLKPYIVVCIKDNLVTCDALVALRHEMVHVDLIP